MHTPYPSPQSHDSYELQHGTPVPKPRAIKNWDIEKVCKRDGRLTPFDEEKIVSAIFRAAKAVGGNDKQEAERLSDIVCGKLVEAGKRFPTVEEIQDLVEKILIEEGHATTAKAYILYRAKRAELRAAAAEATKNNDTERSALFHMFAHKSKLASLMGYDRIEAYKNLLFYLKDLQAQGKLQTNPYNNYLNNNELATNIYQKKYYLKDLRGNLIDKRPEDTFARLAAFVAAVEPDEKRQQVWAEEFYKDLYEGRFLPGGRVIAGAGDLYRLKTLANCFVSLVAEDNIESIYQTAYECARTYSYGGGIGVDISSLRPAGSTVHNAADFSTGAVSFMELYSITTGLIGQSGRRGALMLTLDIKHPDSPLFVRVKKVPNWITKQIVEQCRLGGNFSDEQMGEIERQVRENIQVRSANISLKMSDEFMRAVEEQNEYGPDAILIYEKDRTVSSASIPQGGHVHYSFGIPSKPIEQYVLAGSFKSISEANAFLAERGCTPLTEEILANGERRDAFGDYLLSTPSRDKDFAVKYSGDFMLYFNSVETGEIKKLIKARELWDAFIEGNYRTAEPGLIFWTNMTRFSPSNYVGRPIASTNPCGEVPLEDGGACNLGSINLSRFVKDAYTEQAAIDWEQLARVTVMITRFLDNVVTWNETLNPLEKQRKAARETRRLGIGVMGIADMLNHLGIGYDSEEGIVAMERVMKFIANAAYRASAALAEEKGPSPIFDYELYRRGEFFQKNLEEETRMVIQRKGLRNIALLSIAPTGTISNIILSYTVGEENFIGVSGGIEPVFALYYTRRSESFQNQLFKVFHSTVDAYLHQKKLHSSAQRAGTTEELKALLPPHFFRTAHFIAPDKRVEIQSVCQQYIDHSISSTVNLAEDIEPEVVSNIYLDAWRKGLKGITIYRDGSRFPILSVESDKTPFHEFKNNLFVWENREVRGDDVISLPDGRLTTPFHAINSNLVSVENGRLTFVRERKTIQEESPFGFMPPVQEVSVPPQENLRVTFASALDSSEVSPQDARHAEKEERQPEEALFGFVGGGESNIETQSVYAESARLHVCPVCGRQTLKVENGCSSCVSEDCGYGQCDS